MTRVTWTRQRLDDAPRVGVRRARASIDLRGQGSALNAAAQSAHMPMSALVRTILAEWLATHADVKGGNHENDARRADALTRRKAATCVKVTLRLPVDSAILLAGRARAAELSQGIYVARLVDGQPPVPMTPDRREDRAALLQSTATLAAMSSDLCALMRALRQPSSPAQAACRIAVIQLSDAVHQHLTATAPLIAALKPSRRSAAGPPD